MSAAKHTPGPWRLEPFARTQAGDDAAHFVWNATNETEVARCLFRRGDVEADECARADARLIAVAPLMADFFARLRTRLEDESDITNSGGPNQAMRLLAEFEADFAAIAKARGE